MVVLVALAVVLALVAAYVVQGRGDDSLTAGPSAGAAVASERPRPTDGGGTAIPPTVGDTAPPGTDPAPAELEPTTTTVAPSTVPSPPRRAPSTDASPVTASPTVPPPTPLPTRAPTPPSSTPPPTVAPATRTPGPLDSFRGLGAWLDVLDWSPTYTGNNAGFAYPADLDAMALHGVQTLYIQTSRFNRPEDVLDPGLLGKIIARAHTHHMQVVGWYLPTHEDPDADLRRLLAAANLPVDAIGVDIESTAQTDIAARNANLVRLSSDLRAATAKPIAAIVLPPVVTDVLNTHYWPQFPWATLAHLYDVWMPMGYWTNRTAESGWRDGYRYTAENIDRVRAHLGNAGAAVHPVGGIADQVSPDEVAGMARAVSERGAIGGSLYDYRTTGADLWPNLQALRR